MQQVALFTNGCLAASMLTACTCSILSRHHAFLFLGLVCLSCIVGMIMVTARTASRSLETVSTSHVPPSQHVAWVFCSTFRGQERL
jgi:heme A synthase